MSSAVSPDLYPIAVIEDRYQGIYSKGRWWAVAQCDCLLAGMSRLAWLQDYGPGSDDVTASVFWRLAPPWIAAGNTPDAAVANLKGQEGADSDEWSPPPIEADPRWRESFRPPHQPKP